MSACSTRPPITSLLPAAVAINRSTNCTEARRQGLPRRAQAELETLQGVARLAQGLWQLRSASQSLVHVGFFIPSCTRTPACCCGLPDHCPDLTMAGRQRRPTTCALSTSWCAVLALEGAFSLGAASPALQQLTPIQQVFVLMQLVHSEALADQVVSVALLLRLTICVDPWASRRVF